MPDVSVVYMQDLSEGHQSGMLSKRGSDSTTCRYTLFILTPPKLSKDENYPVTQLDCVDCVGLRVVSLDRPRLKNEPMYVVLKYLILILLFKNI
jgi:hypothetical protein